MKQFIAAATLITAYCIATAGVDKPWQESSAGFLGGTATPLIMLTIGFAYPVYSKLTNKDYSWLEFFMHGALFSVLSVMLVQVGLLVALLFPAYLLYKFFTK